MLWFEFKTECPHILFYLMFTKKPYYRREEEKGNAYRCQVVCPLLHRR